MVEAQCSSSRDRSSQSIGNKCDTRNILCNNCFLVQDGGEFRRSCRPAFNTARRRPGWIKSTITQIEPVPSQGAGVGSTPLQPRQAARSTIMRMPSSARSQRACPLLCGSPAESVEVPGTRSYTITCPECSRFDISSGAIEMTGRLSATRLPLVRKAAREAIEPWCG